MKGLVLHAQTKSQILHFGEQPAHAVLLAGPNGVGKGSLAEHIVNTALGIAPEKLAQYPYIARIAPEKASISIDSVRELQKFLQLKTIGTAPLRRAVIIEYADTMTTEAQNAFLKLLEEPPADTIVVLTADNRRALLPTILSRAQVITVYPPAETELTDHFINSGKNQKSVTQAYFLSGGQPGLMAALLYEDNTHPLMSSVGLAKEILQKTTFERLALVDSLAKQKDEAAALLEALQHIAQTGLAQAAKKEDTTRIKQWHRIVKHVSEGREALGRNASAKLVLTNLMLQV